MAGELRARGAMAIETGHGLTERRVEAVRQVLEQHPWRIERAGHQARRIIQAYIVGESITDICVELVGQAWEPLFDAALGAIIDVNRGEA